MFVTTKTYAAAIREKNEVIEGLMRRLNALDASCDRVHDLLISAEARNNELRSRLAPFERQRGKGGRFVKKGME